MAYPMAEAMRMLCWRMRPAPRGPPLMISTESAGEAIAGIRQLIDEHKRNWNALCDEVRRSAAAFNMETISASPRRCDPPLIGTRESKCHPRDCPIRFLRARSERGGHRAGDRGAAHPERSPLRLPPRWTLTAFPGLRRHAGGNHGGGEALVAAYSEDGKDLVFYLDDGVTPTATLALQRQHAGGHARAAAIVPHGDRGRVQHVPQLYGRSLGDVPLTNNNLLLDYEETIEVQGNGGPIRVLIPVALGPWVWQQTTVASIFRVTQSGRAKGLYAYPPFNAPLWPANLVSERMSLRSQSPRLRRNQSTSFP